MVPTSRALISIELTTLSMNLTLQGFTMGTTVSIYMKDAGKKASKTLEALSEATGASRGEVLEALLTIGPEKLQRLVQARLEAVRANFPPAKRGRKARPHEDATGVVADAVGGTTSVDDTKRTLDAATQRALDSANYPGMTRERLVANLVACGMDPEYSALAELTVDLFERNHPGA